MRRRRTRDEAEVYAMRRVTRAVDRVILGDESARVWVHRWARVAGLRIPEGSGAPVAPQVDQRRRP